MGRTCTVNFNLPPGVHKRTVRREGKEYTYYSYQISSKPRREIPLGKDYASAIVKWAELSSRAPLPFVEKPTFIDLKIRYIAKVIPTKAARTQRDNFREIEMLEKFFGSPPAPIDEIRPMHVRQYMQWRTSSGDAYVRANREKALLSHMFNFAREEGLTDNQNPCRGIKGFSEQGRSHVYIEDEEYEQVISCADQPTAFALRLAYLTGQRPADVIGLDLSQIKPGIIQFDQRKTGARLRMKIVGELAVLLDEILSYRKEKKSMHTLLLCNERGARLTYEAFRQRFDKARAKSKISPNDFQFRDLRAKAATDTEEITGSIRKAQQQLGHVNLSMTEHYTRQRRGQTASPTR